MGYSEESGFCTGEALVGSSEKKGGKEKGEKGGWLPNDAVCLP